MFYKAKINPPSTMSTHRYNTRFQAKLSSSKKTFTPVMRIPYYTRLQSDRNTLRTIESHLRNSCQTHGIAQVDACIVLFNYLHEYKHFLKKNERLLAVVLETIERFQNEDLVYALERSQSNGNIELEDKLHELDESTYKLYLTLKK